MLLHPAPHPYHCCKLHPAPAEEGVVHNSLYEASITVGQKPDKDITRKVNQSPRSQEHRCKNPQQNISKFIPTMYKKNYAQPSGFIPDMQDLSQQLKITSCNPSYQQTKEK